MSSLSLLNSSGVMPFLTLTAVFLFIGPVLFIGIATMWSNLKQKISDELSACVTKIVNDLDIKNNTPEIENIFSKLTAEINTNIANELTARLSEINASFTVELGRINTELNGKLTAEIENFKARDVGYVTEAQKIFARLFNIEEARRNDFDRISSLKKFVIVSIDDLYKKINQRFEVAISTNIVSPMNLKF